MPSLGHTRTYTGAQRQQMGIPATVFRGVRTTWATLASVPFKEILDAAVRTHPQTLAQFYLKDLPAKKAWFSIVRSTAFDRMVVFCLLCWATIIHSIYLRFMSGPSMQRCLFNFLSSDFWKYFSSISSYFWRIFLVRGRGKDSSTENATWLAEISWWYHFNQNRQGNSLIYDTRALFPMLVFIKKENSETNVKKTVKKWRFQ